MKYQYIKRHQTQTSEHTYCMSATGACMYESCLADFYIHFVNRQWAYSYVFCSCHYIVTLYCLNCRGRGKKGSLSSTNKFRKYKKPSYVFSRTLSHHFLPVSFFHAHVHTYELFLHSENKKSGYPKAVITS